MAKGALWNFNFSPLPGGAQQNAAARAIDWGNLGQSLGQLAQMGQQQAASGPDEYYRSQFAGAPLQQQLDWRTQGNLIPEAHRKLVSPEVLNQYRNTTPEAALQWDALRAKSDEVQRQRRDWGRQDAAYDRLQAWARGMQANGSNAAAAAPDALAMNRGMLNLALANNDAALASKWAQGLHTAQEDALMARAMTGAASGAGVNPGAAQYLSGFNARLGTGAQDRYGLQRGVLENAGRDARFNQLGLAQQRQLAAADALMAHNPQRAWEIVGAVNKNLAQDVDRENHLRAQLWSGNNQAAYQSAGLGRQDAQLAENMRHNRFNEGMAAQRLNWDMHSRAQAGSGGAGNAGRSNYDPAKIRQWYMAEDEAGGKTFDQAGYERLGEAMVQYPEADPAQLHRLLQMQDAAQRLQRRADVASIQNHFNAGDFAQFMAAEGVAPHDAREVRDFAHNMGLALGARQAQETLVAMRRQQEMARNRARYDEEAILRAIDSGQSLPDSALMHAPASLRARYAQARRGQ